jgi:hypothetical protein
VSSLRSSPRQTALRCALPCAALLHPAEVDPRAPAQSTQRRNIMAKKTTKLASDVTRYTAYTVRNFERNGDTEHDWMRIGVAFPHEDGKGFNLSLHALPVDGKIVVRLYEPKDENTQG